MEDAPEDRCNRDCPPLARPALLRNLLPAAGAVSVLAFLITAWMRLPYAYELEWAEGGVLEHVRRVLAGQPLYVRPSLSFTPFEYTPLYYWVSAAAAKVFGTGFFALRLVSVAASLGSFLLIWEFVRRETRSASCGFIAASLFLATYSLGEACFDLARIDVLMVFFLLAAVCVLRFGRTAWAAALAGALMSLAFLTKQSALVVALPLMAFSLVQRPRLRGVVFSVTFLGILFVTTAVGDRLTGGWYSFYVFDLVRQHGIYRPGVFGFWLVDVQPLAIAFAFAVGGLLAALATKRWSDLTFFLALLVGGIAAGWFSRMHPGGGHNVLLPTYAVAAMLFGIGLHAASSAIGERAAPPAGRAETHPWGIAALYAACLIQFALMAYNPMLLVPNVNDKAAGDAFVKKVAKIEGEVFIPYHGYLARLAGKEPYAHALALADVLRGTDEPVRGELMQEIRDALRQRRFAAIFDEESVYDEKFNLLAYFTDEMKRDYEYRGDVFSVKGLFGAVPGSTERPQRIYLPRP